MEVPLPHGCRWRTFSFNVGYANARQRKTLILSVWKGYRMCVTLSHIQNLKRILVWNWQLLKQARIRSWESWSARWSYRWATSRKDCPACAGQVNGCAGRMWWTYAQTLSEEFPAASPWVWPERQMRGVRCGVTSPRSCISCLWFQDWAAWHCIHLPERHIRGVFLFIRTPIFFNQFDSNGQ